MNFWDIILICVIASAIHTGLIALFAYKIAKASQERNMLLVLKSFDKGK